MNMMRALVNVVYTFWLFFLLDQKESKDQEL
jgi:hypothetical protein